MKKNKLLIPRYEGNPGDMAMMSVGFANAIIDRLNALLSMRAGEGITITMAESGAVISGVPQTVSNGTDSGEKHWYIFCRRNPTTGVSSRFAACLHGTRFYPVTVDAFGNYTVTGPVENHEPYSNTALPS